MAIHSSILAWRISWTEEPGGLQSMASQRRGHNWSNLALMYAAVIQSPSHVQFFATPWTAAHQASLSLTISQSLSKFMFIASVMPSSLLILVHILLLLPSIFPSIRDFSNESSVCIRWPKYWSFSFSISLSNEYSELISLKDWLVWSPCCPRGFQVSSPTPWFKGINSLVFCLLYIPAFTTVHDHWEYHSLDCIDLCQQINSVFQHTVYVCHCFPAKKQSSSDFTAAITICNNFGAQEEEICHYLSPSSRGSSVPLCFLPLAWYHLRIWSCWCFSHLSWFQLVTHAAWHFSWYAQYIGLNKQGNSRQPCCTPFLILNQSIVPYRVLTVTSWSGFPEASYRFLRRQIRWSGIPISLRAFHNLSWSTQPKASA